MDELAGQVAVVTGGGRGIGRAIAMAFAQAGAAVMVTARSKDEIEETASLIKAAGGRAAACPADMIDHGAVQEVLAATESELGETTLLVNNAGGSIPGMSGRFETLDPDAIVRGLQLNLVAPMLCTRAFLPGMVARKRGRIINVSSGAGMLGMPFLASYGVAKTAIIRFSEVLALENLDNGIAVFAITPGNVLSRLTAPLWPKRQERIDNPPPNSSWIFPPGHALEDNGWYPPERAAALCRFLAAGKADRLSGRFFSVHYDEADIVAQADRVEREQLYTLRPVTLQGIEPPILYGKHTSKK